ncbi:hypothetical protein M378DRAFT_179998 [Amanita muscaria Koide BX008]|uniref:Uncharacterized protein n=1 Tax=Amanita muscaria (strain Koide BX008) TaxID=946122 RepID=A0A0C2SF57_AMAMK|nr:hypothetical protein M378DRAFT_179998 [Amanita muscaria Koide BX008]
MAVEVPPTLSVLVSVWLETLCYGINTVIYFICLYIFIARKSPQKAQKALLVLSTLLYLSATAHVSVNLRRLIEGYVLPQTKVEMMQYLVDIAQPLDIAKQYLVVSTSFISDLIISWRVYIVWSFDWRITIIPILLSFGVLASGLGVATSIAIAKPGQTIFFKLTGSFGTAMLCLSLIMNVTATALIASRIWWISRASQTFTPARSFLAISSSDPASATFAHGNESLGGWRKRNQQYWRLIILMVESAALISIVQLFILAFYLAKHPAVYFMGDLSVQVDSMAPLMIIAFIGLLNARPGRNWMNSTALDTRNTSGDATKWERRAVIPSVPRMQLRRSLSHLRFHTSLSESVTDRIELESKKDLPELLSVGGKDGEVMGIAV